MGWNQQLKAKSDKNNEKVKDFIGGFYTRKEDDSIDGLSALIYFYDILQGKTIDPAYAIGYCIVFRSDKVFLYTRDAWGPSSLGDLKPHGDARTFIKTIFEVKFDKIDRGLN